MNHFANNSNLDRQLFGILLSPSWLSGFVSAFISIGVVVVTMVSASYSASDTRLQFMKFHLERSQASSGAIGHALDSNKFIGNLPLLLFWCLMGFVVYMFAINVVGAIHQAAELNDELAHFTHLNRRQIIGQAIEKLLIRLIVLAVWIPYIIVFFHHIVPFSVASALAALPILYTPTGIYYVVLAVVVLFAALQIHVILLRLLALRPRLFSNAVYTS
jgi:hypothetical protein